MEFLRRMLDFRDFAPLETRSVDRISLSSPYIWCSCRTGHRYLAILNFHVQVQLSPYGEHALSV